MKASAEIALITVPQPPTPVPDKVEKRVVLSLSEAQAEVLKGILGRRFGCCAYGSLYNTDDIWQALADAGILSNVGDFL